MKKGTKKRERIVKVLGRNGKVVITIALRIEAIGLEADELDRGAQELLGELTSVWSSVPVLQIDEMSQRQAARW